MSAPDRELHDQLSAYLDDELDATERTEIEAALAASAELTAELDAVRAARELVRSLPDVEVPAGFRFVPTGHSETAPVTSLADVRTSAKRRRTAAARNESWARKAAWRSVVAVAAAFALLVGAGSIIPGVEVVPAVDDLVRVHTAAATELMAMPPAEAAPTMPMPLDDGKMLMVDMSGDAPDLGAELPLMGGYEDDDYVHLVYGAEQQYLSVFRQEGRLDGDELDGATAMDMDDATAAYSLERDSVKVLVLEQDGMVYTIVSDDAMVDKAMGMTAMLPPDDDNFVVDAFENLGGALENLGGLF
ncbi:MAG: hypothetical protein HKN26_02330 [Acidimicrobiales bacterium]|nr:hypothetical protein [Acidimicrobiales bacterium]